MKYLTYLNMYLNSAITYSVEGQINDFNKDIQQRQREGEITFMTYMCAVFLTWIQLVEILHNLF